MSKLRSVPKKVTGDRLLSVRLSETLMLRLELSCAAAGITVSEGVRQLIGGLEEQQEYVNENSTMYDSAKGL